MNCRKEDMVLYAITDRHWLNGESLYQQVEKALQGGVTFLQLREKKLDKELVYLPRRLSRLFLQRSMVQIIWVWELFFLPVLRQMQLVFHMKH